MGDNVRNPTQQFIVNPGDRGAALDVIGVKVTVLVSDAASQAQKITLQVGDEGAGPPPHSHPWDESFYVTRGELQFACGGQTTRCLAGTLVHIPAGTIHAFRSGPGGGEMLEVTDGQQGSPDVLGTGSRDSAGSA